VITLVEVSVPLRTDYIATLRTVAASMGADAGFSVDEIDDLRLAISEIVSSLIDASASNGDRIVATFDAGASRVSVAITTRRGELQIELDDLATSILHSVVDEYEVAGARVDLVKRASEGAGRSEATVERTVRGA
jgi:serine/threonine-protein kinase RsbW